MLKQLIDFYCLLLSKTWLIFKYEKYFHLITKLLANAAENVLRRVYYHYLTFTQKVRHTGKKMLLTATRKMFIQFVGIDLNCFDQQEVYINLNKASFIFCIPM